MNQDDKLILKKLTIYGEDDVYDMFQNIKPGPHQFKNEVYGERYEFFRKWAVKMNDWDRSQYLPKGCPPHHVYILYLNETPIGVGKITDFLTDETKKCGGTVQFAFDDRFIDRKYDRDFLVMLINEFKNYKLEDIAMTVEKDYPESKAIVEYCDFNLVNEDSDRWYFKFKEM